MIGKNQLLELACIISFLSGENDDETLSDIAATCRALAREADKKIRQIVIARSKNHVDN
jgi:hypothetical protein